MAKLLIKHLTHENLWLPAVPHMTKNVVWVTYEQAVEFDTSEHAEDAVEELASYVGGRVVEIDLGELRLKRLRIVARYQSRSEASTVYNIFYNPNGGMYSCQCKGYHYSRSATPTCYHVRDYLMSQDKTWHAQAQR